MATQVEDVLQFFDRSDDYYDSGTVSTFSLMPGYLCMYEGFEIDTVLYITHEDGQYTLATPDTHIKLVNGLAKHGYEINVYETKKVA